MNIYSIYKATCEITGKHYIGFTKNLKKRMWAHKRASENNINELFYRATRKHGWDNFDWEIIYQSLDYDHCLNTMEPYFIGYYDSFANGYNSTLGGAGTKGSKTLPKGYDHGPEHNEKLKQGWVKRRERGRDVVTTETRQLLTNKLLGNQRTKGFVWSYDPITLETKYCLPENKPVHYIRGQLKHKNLVWCNNGIDRIMCKTKDIPEGYKRGKSLC